MKSVAFLLVSLPLLAVARERACCKYSCQQGSVDCPDYCDDSFSCVIRGPNDVFVTESECEVKRDSKKDKEEESGCASEKFKSTMRFSGPLPFRVLTYPFSGVASQSSFVGIDVRFAPTNDTRLRFRLRNKSLFCLSSPSNCHPRCVDFSRPAVQGHLKKPLTELSYDCEVGFLIQGKVWRSTAGDDYELAVCAGEQHKETCGLYTFRLPDAELVEKVDQELILLDLSDGVGVHVPLAESVAELRVQLVQPRDNMSSQVVEDLLVVPTLQEKIKGSIIVKMTEDLPYGRSRILVTGFDEMGNVAGSPLISATITVPHPGYDFTAFVVVVFAAIVISGVVFVSYKKWTIAVETAAVEPQELVIDGQLEPVELLVVTALDNPVHVEVVKLLCRYLRTWCGVSKTYFALDEEVGVGGGDPWKWCQETGDIVRQNQNGSILFLAGPDCSESRDSSIHPNLEQNQAFLSTAHLHLMAGEGRLHVATLPYSDASSLPSELPAHLKTSAHHLPDQMNDFLVALLRLPKQPVCGLQWAPLSFKPSVRPADLKRDGGPQLLAKVEELSLATQPVHKPSYQVPSNKITLKDRKEEQTFLLQKNGKHKDETLKIELEEGLPSVLDLENRDRSQTED